MQLQRLSSREKSPFAYAIIAVIFLAEQAATCILYYVENIIRNILRIRDPQIHHQTDDVINSKYHYYSCLLLSFQILSPRWISYWECVSYCILAYVAFPRLMITAVFMIFYPITSDDVAGKGRNPGAQGFKNVCKSKLYYTI